MIHLRFLTCIIFILTIRITWGQSKTQVENIEKQEITIVKDFSIFVEEANKITPTIEYNANYQEKIDNSNLNYNIPDRIESFKFEPTVVRPMNYTQPDTLLTNNNYVKLAFGTILNPLLEWNHNIFRSNTRTNMYIQHHSAWSPQQSQMTYSSTIGRITHTINKRQWNLRPMLEIQNLDYHFYGNLIESQNQSNSNRFYTMGRIGLGAEYIENRPKKISWTGSLIVDMAREDFNNQNITIGHNEYQYELLSRIKYLFSQNLSIYFNQKASVAQTNFDGKWHRVILSGQPEIHYNAKALKLIGALEIASTQARGNSAIYVLPRLETEVQLVPNFVTLFSIWNRSLTNNLMSHWMTYNPFVGDYSQGVPLTRVENRGAGFKGSYRHFSYNASFTQRIVKDAVLYANDSLNPRFLKALIEKSMTQSDLNLEVYYKTPIALSFVLKGNFQLFELDNLKMAYNLPALVTNFGVQYCPKPKWNLMLNTLAISGVKSEIAGNTITTPLQLDLNLSSEYLIRRNLYLIGLVNNLFDTKVNRVVGYNSYGINGQIGVRWLY